MTSETEILKTNEFLRRRKLRLQQVREQSKDIAKKIRQRAQAETLRQVVDLDAKKQKEYFDRQEKLVKRLELLYARGVNNVGASHQSASEVLLQGEATKTDLSKLRGKEAAAELKKKKQERLDEQKKLLERKIHAREAANEISREKSSQGATKPPPKTTKEDLMSKEKSTDVVKDKDVQTVTVDSDAAAKTDMATQWEADAQANQWQPAVPALSLPKDEGSSKDEAVGSKDKNKRLDLFALSNEMPSDLRGGLVDVTESMPSVTLVTEYLQSRQLRLREMEAANTRRSNDMSSLRQTIQRTRMSKGKFSPCNACRVVDEQVIPVPSWHAERNCKFCVHNNGDHKSSVQNERLNAITDSQMNRMFSSMRPVVPSTMMPTPVLRSTSPFRRNRLCQKFSPAKTSIGTDMKQDSAPTRRDTVQMYNHNTRDTLELPRADDNLVVRDPLTEEDAYSQAMKEVSTEQGKDKEHQKKVQDMRNKVAVTKQAVEKEYKDTINFLNSLPKDRGCKVTKTAYMDDRRQQMQKEHRQHRMQQEYRKIERECRRNHSCASKTSSKSRSPSKAEDEFKRQDLQYSWMPVPEADEELAIHTIPNTVKEGKSGNTVKFSKVDSYHEYRSRHKHTPPTKEKPAQPTTLLNDSSGSTYESSSCTSSTENLNLDKATKGKSERRSESNLSDSERIIIYKILDSKSQNYLKRKKKILGDASMSLSSFEKKRQSVDEDSRSEPVRKSSSNSGKSTVKSSDNAVAFEHINEGIYKMAEEAGDNVMTLMSNTGPNTLHKYMEEHPCSCGHRGTSTQQVQDRDSQPKRPPKTCHCSSSEGQQITVSEGTTTQGASQPTLPENSATTFKTASEDKQNTAVVEAGCIKLLDETGQEAGKFFLGTTGILKDNAYEVVIQLRKKDVKESRKSPVRQLSQQPTEIRLDDREKVDPVENKLQVSPESETHKDVPKPKSPVISSKPKSPAVPPQLKSPEILPKPKSPEVPLDHSTENKKASAKDTSETTKLINALIENFAASHRANDQRVPSYKEKVVSKKDVPTQSEPSRPPTTIYTQTTNSPLHRPLYMHMSTSTSTAYMSPPDMIMPEFLRRESSATEDEVPSLDTLERQSSYNNYVRKCRHVEPSRSRANEKQSTYREHKQQTTPPNSARTCSSRYKHDQDYVTGKKKCLCKLNCKCGNGVTVPTKTHSQRRCHRKKHVAVDTCRSSSKNLSMYFGKIDIPKNKNKPSFRYHNTNSGSRLHPIVKEYVNRLLNLNKEGLKLMDVADQECSSVGTPGSSIINVPYNLDKNKSVENKISLEQLKVAFLQKIMDTQYQNNLINKISSGACRKSRRKPVHKVKSLNISKKLKAQAPKRSKLVSASTTTDDNAKMVASSAVSTSRPSSLPTDKRANAANTPPLEKDPKKTAQKKISHPDTHKTKSAPTKANHCQRENRDKDIIIPPKRTTTSNVSSESKSSSDSHKYFRHKIDIPISMSTQTSQHIDKDMQFAEDKLHNMEKIADLTEKCTKRLSNLAKVLEEVRKNKSLVYSQISASDSTDSHSDHKSDKLVQTPLPSDRDTVEVGVETKSPRSASDEESTKENKTTEPHSVFRQFLANIPKPSVISSPPPAQSSAQALIQAEPNSNDTNLVSPLAAPSKNTLNQTDTVSSMNLIRSPSVHENSDASSTDFAKYRPKPPPALSRVHFKHNKEFIVAHELSTVMEVDSPLSVKTNNQTQSTRNDVPNSNRSSGEDQEQTKDQEKPASSRKEATINPDLVQRRNVSSSDPPEDSKLNMIDLKHFNEIMLEPFISIHEYVKKFNVAVPDEGSNMEDVHKDEVANDDMSSLHSDGSLPDVIAELLKRNIIAEPFKFDTPSNVNSTTLSSESTLSLLALSKVRKGKKRANIIFRNKENIGETSDTLSISSNPDLENAFKKLGMGWASSTLKKTKERLALSSSSNTSSSSMSQFKIKTMNQDIPALVTDSVSSVLLSKANKHADHSKHAEQQTSNYSSNSMTVKDFLTKELANKITFNNKTQMNDTEEEFISLYETKMPDALKQSHVNREENSNDSGGSIIRARTSTPVQIFKSMTYHSSSSNISNGLFSNADDLSSVKMTSNSMKNHSTSDKDDNLTIPNFSLRMKKGSDSKSD